MKDVGVEVDSFGTGRWVTVKAILEEGIQKGLTVSLCFERRILGFRTGLGELSPCMYQMGYLTDDRRDIGGETSLETCTPGGGTCDIRQCIVSYVTWNVHTPRSPPFLDDLI